MATDKDAAAAWLVLAEVADERGLTALAVARRRIAAELDPPKPKWADGTVAWVTAETGRSWLAVRTGGGWVIGGNEFGSHIGDRVTKVEPLRVLGDDEIALPREVFERFTVGTNARKASGQYAAVGERFAASVMRAYADARVAEAGGAK